MPGGVCRLQVAPPLAVASMVPHAPTAQPWTASGTATASRSTVVPEVHVDQPPAAHGDEGGCAGGQRQGESEQEQRRRPAAHHRLPLVLSPRRAPGARRAGARGAAQGGLRRRALDDRDQLPGGQACARRRRGAGVAASRTSGASTSVLPGAGNSASRRSPTGSSPCAARSCARSLHKDCPDRAEAQKSLTRYRTRRDRPLEAAKLE